MLYRTAIIASSKLEAAELLRNHRDEPLVGRVIGSNQSTSSDIATQFVNGEQVDWSTIYASKVKVIDCPTYPWQHQSFWIASNQTKVEQPLSRDARLLSETVKPIIDRPALSSTFVAPTNHLEAWLAVQWSQSLRVSQVGIEDNFFELGGDSLQAGAMLNHLQAELNEPIQMLAIFESQTIGKLAAYLREKHKQAIERLENLSPPTELKSVSPLVDAGRGELEIEKVRDEVREEFANEVVASLQSIRRSRVRHSVSQMDDRSIEELLRKKMQTRAPSVSDIAEVATISVSDIAEVAKNLASTSDGDAK
jgi:acyl transferase domain-containing protein